MGTAESGVSSSAPPPWPPTPAGTARSCLSPGSPWRDRGIDHGQKPSSDVSGAKLSRTRAPHRPSTMTGNVQNPSREVARYAAQCSRSRGDRHPRCAPEDGVASRAVTAWSMPCLNGGWLESPSRRWLALRRGISGQHGSGTVRSVPGGADGGRRRGAGSDAVDVSAAGPTAARAGRLRGRSGSGTERDPGRGRDGHLRPVRPGRADRHRRGGELPREPANHRRTVSRSGRLEPVASTSSLQWCSCPSWTPSSSGRAAPRSFA